jgi:hypothetical protein
MVFLWFVCTFSSLYCDYEKLSMSISYLSFLTTSIYDFCDGFEYEIFLHGLHLILYNVRDYHIFLEQISLDILMEFKNN